MSATGAVTVTGSVLDTEFKQGGQGDSAYAYHLVHVLTGKTVTVVRWDTQKLELPKADQHVSVDVELSAYRDRVTVRAVRWAQPVQAVKAS